VIEDYYYNLTTNSKYNGRLTIYNDSERITYKIKDGLKDGKSKIYNSIGTLIDTIDYKNGIKINKK
jgi:antitoxin component YwqK of YwqJK toxin-antitoxin module